MCDPGLGDRTSLGYFGSRFNSAKNFTQSGKFVQSGKYQVKLFKANPFSYKWPHKSSNNLQKP